MNSTRHLTTLTVKSLCNGAIATAVAFCVLAAQPVFANLFEPELTLSDLASGDGSIGTVFTGLGGIDQLGTEVSGIGDVNGDGLDDFALAAIGASRPPDGQVGIVYILFGTEDGFGNEFDLSSLTAAGGGDGSAGVVVFGNRPGEGCCRSISAAGDVNGDGIDDVILGSERALESPASNFRGRAFLIFGTSSGFPAQIDLADLLASNGGDGSVGVVFSGRREFGSSVDTAGDFNADGIDDIIIGSQRDFGGGIVFAGVSYVIFGRQTPFEAEYSIPTSFDSGDGTNSGVYYDGIDAFELSGSAVSHAGDLNADGISDIVIGAADTDVNGVSNSGRCYIVFGTNNLPDVQVNLSGLAAVNGGDGSSGVILNGAGVDDRVCTDIDRAGDMNGDGIDDIVLGGRDAEIDRLSPGAAFVIHGSATGFAPEIDLSDLLLDNGGDGTAGVVIEGIDFRDSTGFSVAGAADVNGDGLDDLLVGAPLADPNGIISAGEAYVLFGRPDGLPIESSFAALTASNGGDGSDGFVLSGFESGAVGFAAALPGDVDGDGAADLLLGANFGANNAGRAYLIYGRRDTDDDQIGDRQDNCTLTSNPDQADADGDGYGTACDADFNQDCVVNFVDLGLFRTAFFSSDPVFDLSGDGIVNAVDLGIFRSLFFAPPGPSGVSDACSET